jgi:hypothetical protein
MSRFFAGLLLILLSACGKDPCLDIAALDALSAETKAWFAGDSIGNKVITDAQGISQTMIMGSPYYHESEVAVEDDCGQTYGSFYYSLQYRTSMSPLHFMVNICGSGWEADGFYLELSVMNLSNSERKTTRYDFKTHTGRDQNAEIHFQEQTEVFGRIYEDVLEINFLQTFSPNDVKTVYYAKGWGIIRFIKENGNSFGIFHP